MPPPNIRKRSTVANYATKLFGAMPSRVEGTYTATRYSADNFVARIFRKRQPRLLLHEWQSLIYQEAQIVSITSIVFYTALPHCFLIRPLAFLWVINALRQSWRDKHSRSWRDFLIMNQIIKDLSRPNSSIARPIPRTIITNN